MTNSTKLFVVFFALSISISAQVQPGYNISIFVTDDVAIPRKLTFGLDPLATDGIDTLFGESDLPPFPPPGGFDARLNLPADNFSGIRSSWIDIRQATFPFTGQKEFRLRYQPGFGSIIKISWNFPSEITGRLQDVVLGSLIDVNMSGQDSFVVTNPIAFDRLKMTINFNNIVSGIEEWNDVPEGYFLEQNYPNPFNPSTTISFTLQNSDMVNVKVFDVMGCEVAELLKELKPAGKHSITFTPGNISSGIYFYKISSGKFSSVRKMNFIK